MENKRNISTDLIRATALLLVVVYHSWVLSGSYDGIIFPIKLIIMLGGEIGVTAFFVISGFGIFSSLDNKEQSYLNFLKRRFKRIAPEYYLFLIFLILFGSAVGYLSLAGLKDIVLHMLFLHNMTPQTAGTINGVLWTMAVTVQFYIVAIPMYKMIKKNPILSIIISIGFTIIFKFICFHYLMEHFFVGQFFWYSREIFPSVFDNFTIGMFVSYLCKKSKGHNMKILNCLTVFFIFMIYIVAFVGIKYGIHTDNISGYIWHTLVAILIGGIIYCFYKYDFNKSNKIVQLLLYLSKHEYGIYIVHLSLMMNILSGSELISVIHNCSVYLLYFILVVLSLLVGILYSNIVNSIRIH